MKSIPIGACMADRSGGRLVFAQIFIDKGYPYLPDMESALIIDCGANVGYSSLVFLNRYKQARVFAIEPDDRNHALLRRNLAPPYGDRIQTVYGAVWPRERRLRVIQGSYRDGLE